jgi:hypothetical protein
MVMRRISMLLAVLVSSVTLASCTVVSLDTKPRRGHGPPPHAPAHGHRHHHHHGVELAFDSALGAYVVVGHPGYFYSDGFFLRLDGGLWQASVALKGPWRVRSLKSVPPGLRAKGHTKRHKHPDRGRGPAKHGW